MRLTPVPGLLLGLSLLLWPSAARAQGGAEALGGDARLDRKVTLRLGKSPLSRVLAEVGKQVEVTLVASPEVADEPALLLVREQPARDVLRNLASLFHYTWTRGGDREAPRYRLFQDLKARREEEALRDADRVRALARLQSALRSRLALTRLSEEALLRLADRYDDHQRGVHRLDPAQLQAPELALMRRVGSAEPVRELAGPHWRALARFAATLSPDQWEALAAGRTLWFSSRQEPNCLPLPARAAEELRAARADRFSPGRRIRFADAETEVLSRRMDEQTTAQWRRAVAHRVRVRLKLTGDSGRRQAELELVPSTVMPPDFMGEQQMAPGPLKVSSEEAPAPEVIAPPQGSARKDPSLEVRRLWKRVLLRAHSSTESVEWENQVLVRIAETYSVNLISDAYRHRRINFNEFPAEEERPLQEVLERLIAPLSDWERQGAFLRVRRRAWFTDRMAEVPERVADAWEARFRKDPLVTTEDVARLAVSLRDAQLDQLPDVLRERGVRIDDPELHLGPLERPFLRVYGNLTTAQRQLLRSGKVVPFGQMPPVAQASLQAIFDQDAENAPEPPPPASAPPAQLSSPHVAPVWAVDDEGATLHLQVRDAAQLLPSEGPGPSAAVPLSPRGAARLRGREPASNVVFRYHYQGSAFRYFYVLPFVVEVEPKQPERPEPG